MGKGVQTRLVKPTEKADLNNRELLVPRQLGNQHGTDPDPRNLGFCEEVLETMGPSVVVQYLSLA